MKILYLLTRDLDATGEALRREHAKEHTVEVVDMRGNGNFDSVVDEISSADLVISW